MRVLSAKARGSVCLDNNSKRSAVTSRTKRDSIERHCHQYKCLQSLDSTHRFIVVQHAASHEDTEHAATINTEQMLLRLHNSLASQFHDSLSGNGCLNVVTSTAFCNALCCLTGVCDIAANMHARFFMRLTNVATCN
eukprot:8332-Heterococcus_DN1.PRE.1